MDMLRGILDAGVVSVPIAAPTVGLLIYFLIILLRASRD